MLTTMIFSAKGELFSRIQRRCIHMGGLNLFRSPDYLPSAADIIRLINSFNPELAFIEFHDREEALKVESTIHDCCPNVAILGFADNWDGDRVFKTTRGYLRVIPSSITPEDFAQHVDGAMNAIQNAGPNNVIVFMPSKAGSGASTVALNVCGALANKCGRSTILIEADLHSGPAGMYLDLKPVRSVVDALRESHQLESCWNQLITPVQNFAILPACSAENSVPQVSPWAYRRLLTFTRLRYEHVIFDLPEVVNHATEVIVASAKTVYVVCTPEVPSLILARKRCAGLIERGVPEDRLKIVLNRYSKNGPDASAVAEILGYPIAQTIPNDYKSLWEANLKRCLVAEKSVVGLAYESFAWSLAGEPEIAAKPHGKLSGLFSALKMGQNHPTLRNAG
jgi:MinD-like ATPase involved in chromosome partitioning or flagellar assembly